MWFLVAIALLVVGKLVDSRESYEHNPITYPDSQTDFGLCKLTEPGNVCDCDNVLNVKNDVDGVLLLHYASQRVLFHTNCSCTEVDRRFGTCEHKSRGYAVSVVVLRKIAGSSDKSDDSKELIEVFADVLHKRLKRGQCEDDVLIVFSSEDNLLHTVVGSVARRKIHSEIVNQVEQFAKANHINNGDHTSGLLFMINVYGRVLAGENYLEALPPINEAGYTNGLKKILPKWPRWLVFLLIIGIPIFVIVAVIVCAFLFGFRRYIQRHGYTPGRQTT